jgi:triphosphoribosyl-dephospho-CoA synthase
MRRTAERGATPGPAGAARTAQTALAATLACVLEVSAEKVGNVTASRSFADARFEDFVASAFVLGPVIARATPNRVGRTVWDAVEAMRRVTRTNTYLGVALLFAPVAAASRLSTRRPLRRRVAQVLRGLGRDDAAWVYRAIRLTRPGGLGSSAQADVRNAPKMPLREAMALAAHRDSIAREYVEDYGVTFEVALPALRKRLERGLPIGEAIVATHLDLLAAVPDTLIARKAGAAVSRDISARARRVVRAGGARTARGRAALVALDRYLRSDGNRLNPGSTADLIAAALFVWLLAAGVR